jgi:hypothetical protein
LFWLVVMIVNHSVLFLVIDIYTISFHRNVWQIVMTILSLLHMQWIVLIVNLLINRLVVDLWSFKCLFVDLVFRVKDFRDVTFELFFFRLNILDSK